MKRTVFFVVVLSIALGMSGARAASVQQISARSISASYSLVPSGFLNVNASVTTTITVSGTQTTTTQVCVDLFDPFNNFDSGCGPAASASIDPLLLTGSAIAVVPGHFGGIAVSITFNATHVSTSMPYADAELFPTVPPSATTWVNFGRQGRGSATASNAYGTFSISNVPSYAGSSEYVIVTS